jgi:hypothetical protein
VALALSTDPTGAKLGGLTSLPVSHGVASFGTLTINKLGVGYQIGASSSGLQGTTTNPFNVVPQPGGQINPDTPTQIVITAAPSATSPVTAGSPFDVTVALEDSQGVVQTAYSGTVTIALANGPAGASLGDTTTVQANQGIAAFSGLTLNMPASGYVLQATVSGLPATSTAAFTVTSSSAGGGQNGGSPSSNPATGSSGSAGAGSKTAGKGAHHHGHAKKPHKPAKQGHSHHPAGKGKTHKNAVHPSGPHAKTTGHAKAVALVPPDIRSHPLRRRRLM